jgi:DNA modification methylase
MNDDRLKNLSIVYKKLDELSSNPCNGRTHSKGQIRQIAKSIEAFGFLSPILTDNSDVIVAGHGRAAAARILGISTVPTVPIEHLSSDEIRAFMIADNRIAQNAGWDESILAIEFQHLLALDATFDITATGFEVPEIDLIIGGNQVEADVGDTFESPRSSPVSSPGDLWLLGKHRILCGNALERSSFLTVMANRKANLAFLDPPYNIRIDGNVSGKGAIRHSDFAMASGEMTTQQFIDFLTTSLEIAAAFSVDGSIHFVCMDWRHVGELLAAGEKAYDSLLNLCVWAKDKGGQGSFYRSAHEFVFVYRNGKHRHRNNVQLGQFGRYRTNVWNYPSVSTLCRQGHEGNVLAFHPTVKPIAMVADAMLDCSARGDVVLDSFLGSGTTLIAAERVGRMCFGIELNPLYVDVAIRRWQQHTGNDAIHSGSRKTFRESSSVGEDHNV